MANEALAAAIADAAGGASSDPAPATPAANEDVTLAPETLAPEAPATGTVEEPPTEYFGVDLSELPADQRLEVIDHMKALNKQVNQSQREAAEARAAAATPPAAPAAPAPVPTELTDVDLAEALGLDLEDPTDAASARVAIPLARTLLDLKGEVDSLKSGFTENSESSRWNAALDKLESEAGELPVDRSVLIADAKARGISDPDAAYWQAVGPMRAELYRQVQEKLAGARRAGKQGATSPRPAGSPAVAPAALTSKTTKEATLEAIRGYVKDTGMILAD